jgi:hypothetical protein
MEGKYQLKLPKCIRAEKCTKDETKEKYVFVTLHGIQVLGVSNMALTTVSRPDLSQITCAKEEEH